MTTGPIRITEAAPQPAAVVRGHVKQQSALAEFLGEAFEQAGKALAGQGLAPAGPPFARYRVTSDGVDVEAGLPAPSEFSPTGRVVRSQLPGGPVATALHVGDYDRIGFTYEAVIEWLAGNDHVRAGEPWESYLDGPEIGEPRTLVSFPCRRV